MCIRLGRLSQTRYSYPRACRGNQQGYSSLPHPTSRTHPARILSTSHRTSQPAAYDNAKVKPEYMGSMQMRIASPAAKYAHINPHGKHVIR